MDMCCEQISCCLPVASSFDWFRFFEVGAQVAIAIAAILGAIYARIGWRKEARGQNEYKLAIDLLAALYRFRDAIDNARNRFVSDVEMIEDGDDNYEQSYEEKHFKGMTRVYSKRWNRVFDVQQSILTHLPSAEAVWGEEVENLFQKLFVHGAKLRWAIGGYLQSLNPSTPEKLKKILREEIEENAKILYERDKDDDYNDKLKELIAEIETFLKPKLKS
jgi:hypothetical protein